MKNRKLLTLSLAAGLGLGLAGCSDYLDSDYLFDERMTIETVFTNKDYTNEWLARGYFWLNTDYTQDICSKRFVNFNFADDMYYGDTNVTTYATWKQGNYSEGGWESNSLNIWQNCYKGIRQVATFLQNIDMNQELTEAEKNDMKGQAHFLRAYFYWILLRTYGPIPIVPDEGVDYTLEYDELAIPRSSYDECAEYISNECLKAAAWLPLTRSSREIVRPTCGAALSVRAKALLYAASPMNNGGAPAEVQAAMVDNEGNPLLSATYDETRWARAAAAAKDVMDLGVYSLYHEGISTGSLELAHPSTLPPQPDPYGNFDQQDWPNGYRNIDPFNSYRHLFDGTYYPSVTTYGNEVIFTRGKNYDDNNYSIAAMVVHQLPRQGGKGYGCHGMTQKQCDAYYMADGTNTPGMNDMYIGMPGYTESVRYDDRKRSTEIITEEEAANYPELGTQAAGVCKQYAGREPRFYASVAYNGSTWSLLNAQEANDEQSNMQIFYYNGEPNGYQNSTYWLRSGIGIKKYVHPDDISNTQQSSNNDDRIVDKVDPAIRYADILLMYAEAVNEVQGTHNIPSWNGATTHTITRTTDELKKGIQPVRIRAGIPDYSPTEYGSPDLFRIKLKRERQIELFAEGQRYFDIRRWCDADEEETVPLYGCNVYATKTQASLFHTPMEIPEMRNIFSTKMWFWPIDHAELRRNNKLTQNPGWTYPE